MSELTTAPGLIRKLRAKEAGAFLDHLKRLDKDSRRMRFAHSVSDSFVEEYAARMSDMGAIVYGYVVDGEVRAAAELKKLSDAWGSEAEAAFSVEAAYQDHGVGTELMGRVIRSARNRGVHRLFMSCLAENARMQAIARKYEAELKFEYGEVIGEILPQDPDYFSVLAEQIDDRVGYFMAVLDLGARTSKARRAA
jgi:GNAT superfamily N-acetyltransferase